MDTIGISFLPEEIEQLATQRDNQKDKRLSIRFVALLLLAAKSPMDTIAHVIGKSEKTIWNWYTQYRSKGIDSLNSFNYKPKRTYLTEPQIDQVVDWVRKTNPSTTKEVMNHIKEQFNVIYCVEAVRQLLHKRKLKLLLPKEMPGDPPTVEKQQNFVKDYHEMRANSEPGTVDLFGDAMHLVHQNVRARCWGDPKHPPTNRTNSGRKRLNILGAYNPANYKFTHSTNEKTCDAKRAIEYLEKIEREYSDALLIRLRLDNARYFKATLVQEWLEKHKKFQIIYLPPYAPNLNLIERFWKFGKNKLVKNQYHAQYKTFRAKVFQFLNHVDEYQEELKSLMTENFQIIDYKRA